MFTRSGFIRILFLVSLLFFVQITFITEASPHNERILVADITHQQSNTITASPNVVYDSGWIAINSRPDALPIVFTHNIGRPISNDWILLECRDNSELATYDCSNNQFLVDANWYGLSGTTVTAWIRGGSRPDAVRLRIFNHTPAYNSDWQTIGSRPDPIPFPFNHNLGGDPDDYRVVLECRDETDLGTYNCTDFAFNINAHWYGLTNNTVNAWIDNGPRPDEVRLRIYTHPATYDSGWHVIGARPDALPLPFNHNLGGDPDDYRLHLECRDDMELATYDCTGHNFSEDAHWYNLTETAVTVWASNSLPDDVRLRIWTTKEVYLPVILRD